MDAAAQLKAAVDAANVELHLLPQEEDAEPDLDGAANSCSPVCTTANSPVGLPERDTWLGSTSKVQLSSSEHMGASQFRSDPLVFDLSPDLGNIASGIRPVIVGVHPQNLSVDPLTGQEASGGPVSATNPPGNASEHAAALSSPRVASVNPCLAPVLPNLSSVLGVNSDLNQAKTKAASPLVEAVLTSSQPTRASSSLQRPSLAVDVGAASKATATTPSEPCLGRAAFEWKEVVHRRRRGHQLRPDYRPPLPAHKPITIVAGGHQHTPSLRRPNSSMLGSVLGSLGPAVVAADAATFGGAGQAKGKAIVEDSSSRPPGARVNAAVTEAGAIVGRSYAQMARAVQPQHGDTLGPLPLISCAPLVEEKDGWPSVIFSSEIEAEALGVFSNAVVVRFYRGCPTWRNATPPSLYGLIMLPTPWPSSTPGLSWFVCVMSLICNGCFLVSRCSSVHSLSTLVDGVTNLR